MTWIKQENSYEKWVWSFKRLFDIPVKLYYHCHTECEKLNSNNGIITGSASSYCWAEQLETNKWCKTHHTDLLVFIM